LRDKADRWIGWMFVAALLLAPLRLSAATVSYEYDALNRLTQIAYPPAAE